jgi:hypothetical protein
MDDRTRIEMTTKDQLIEAIEMAEARLKQMNNWAISCQVTRLRDLQARLLELDAWAAEPNLVREEA